MNGDGFFSRLGAVFASPGRAMTGVSERPLWMVGGLILIGIMILFGAVTAHIAGPEQMELMRETRFGQMIPEEDWQDRYESALDPSLVDRVVAGIQMAAGTWIVIFIYGLFYLLFGKLAGGTGTFKQVMGVTYWAALIGFGLGYLLRLPLVLIKQSVVEVSLGLAVLAPNADVLSAKYQALTTFGDVFVWWGLIVTIIGFQKVHGFDGGKAATVTLLPWLLVSAALYGLGRLFM